MLQSTRHSTLLDRYRRARVLRVLFLVVAILSSQSSLACAIEEALGGADVELSVTAGVAVASTDAGIADEKPGEHCCSLCIDCINCASCCSVAASLRSDDSPRFGLPLLVATVGFATTAPGLWTPPTLLRPPITAA